MRLIDADALKAYIDAQKGRPFIGCTVGEALKIMTDEQPTIQPKRGRWESVPLKRARICSCCGHDEPYKFADDDTPIYNFCPHCGAKMEVTE